ncbi:MAG: putative inorganic carbon transporter subunit DabA, partial [Candidatus Methylomirabilales bacterium]
MGVQEEHWAAYLTRHLAALPGWASMVRWRGAHPDYQMQEHYPIDLAQYLAVRLFYEAELVSSLCHAEWGIDGTVPALHRYFRDHPGEYFARAQVALGDLPDALAAAVVRLGQGAIDFDWDALADPAYGDMRKARGLSRSDQWFRYAEMLYVYRQGAGHGHDDLQVVYHDAWRVFQLAQLLGLSADDVRSLSADKAKVLLTPLDELPPSSHGPIWLQAYERHYWEQLLPLITGNPRPTRNGTRPRAQVIFCLDVREEGIRRYLESQSETYETFGTAGFFTLPMIFRPQGNGGDRDLCPIVIKPRHTVVEVTRPGDGARDDQREHRTSWREALHG